MISKQLESAFNEQINKEFYSAFLYLSMSAYLADIGLVGFASWMNIQYQEEVAHAMGLFNYLINRGGRVELKTIDAPKLTWDSVLHVFENTLEHEQFVTKLINELSEVAENVKDRAATSFLQWYIDEQVEEEANATEIICKLKLIGADSSSLFTMDKDMAARVFVAPVIG